METVNTFDVNLQLDDTKKYYLAMQLESNAFSYIIFDIEEKKYIGLKQITFNSVSETEIKQSLTNIFNEEPLLSNKFSKVIFQYQSLRGMLVPESLFDSKNLRVFLRFHHDVDDKDLIHFQEIKPAEAFVIFTIPVYLEELLETKYADIIYSHHSVPFIYNAIEIRKNEDNMPSIHIHFANDFFDVLINRNSKILLFNSFFYKKYSDVLFFVANILNLFSIKPNTSKMYLSGQIDEDSEMKNELGKMFNTISFDSLTPELNNILNFQMSSRHRFVNLLNLFYCGL